MGSRMTSPSSKAPRSPVERAPPVSRERLHREASTAAEESRVIIKALRDRRLLLGRTQEAVSIEAGFSPNDVGDYERGTKAPGLLNLVRWARALGGKIKFGEAA